MGESLYWSDKWKTFPDFLIDYLKQKLGIAWGEAELAKPAEARHTLMQWFVTWSEYSQQVVPSEGLRTSPITGAISCLFGVAYALYLLDHNVELQERLLGRLKNPENFQGAYYELVVARILITAGFILTLEDEDDGDTKHCEFAAVSQRTNKRYWVEAKMRGIEGVLGRTNADGGKEEDDPLKRLVRLLTRALAKPAPDERLIFIDLNTVAKITDGKLDWYASAIRRLERYERPQLEKGTSAYVFVTNLSAHRQLHEAPTVAAALFGLGIPDFNPSRPQPVIDIYKQNRKHADALAIGEAIRSLNHLPVTFDGKLPSEAFGWQSRRVVIGQTYDFGDGIVGEVTTATVDEASNEMIAAALTPDGSSMILRAEMTEVDMAEYRAHPEAYFGRVEPIIRDKESPLGLFEWLVEVNAGNSHEVLVQSLAPHFSPDELANMDDEELLLQFCNGLLSTIMQLHPPEDRAAEEEPVHRKKQRHSRRNRSAETPH